MEDQDPPIGATTRRDALDKALSLYITLRPTVMPSADVVLNDILHIANEFHNFLKGDAK